MQNRIILVFPFIFVSACVSTDQSGKKIERLQLSAVEQTMLGQKLSLMRPSETKACPAQSKDMSITVESLKRADEYVEKIYPLVSKGGKAPGKKITINYEDQDLRDALTEISKEVGINIIMGDEVSGTVTVNLEDTNLDRVLRMILSTGNFEYVYNDGFIYVGDGATKKSASAQRFFMIAHDYKTQSATPKMISESLPGSHRQYVTVNDAMGIISINAPRGDFKNILRHVVSLDRPSKQIKLKLSVAVVSDNAMDMLGKKQGGTGYSAMNVLDPIQPSFSQGVYDKMAFDQFLRNIQLLSQTGEAEIKAEPQLMVLDGEKAQFSSKQTSLIRRTDGALDKNNALDGGISMQIEPRIVEHGEVLLAIENAKSGEVDALTRESTSEHALSTRVRVRSGETLVLGGLRQAKINTVIKKVPLLGDVPYLGWLFKTKEEQTQNIQVIFAVSPEIICN
jgi:type IV pilus assembly protein PilQ